MLETTRGMLVPAGKRLLPLLFALIAAAPIAARGDDGMVDVRTLPRLEGAVEEVARTESYRMNYSVPTVVPITTAATRKLLAADGWMEYVHPSSQSSRPMSFKKGRHGLFVSFSQGLGRPDQSVVYYSADRLYANVPFPDDATDIVYDSRRPYLELHDRRSRSRRALDFFRNEIAGAGWRRSPPPISRRAGRTRSSAKRSRTARAPITADDDATAAPGSGRSCWHCSAAATAGPASRSGSRRSRCRQLSKLARDAIGLPMPDTTTETAASTGGSDSIRRRVGGTVVAELPATLAFFRRELAARNWKEETNGAVVTPTTTSP